MKLTGIDHCTVVVTDPERAAAFYRDILGLPEVSSPSTFPGAGLNVRWFKVGDDYIHLFISSKADAPSSRHVALQVEDIAMARKYFESKEVTIRETTPIPGAERFFIADPDGNRIEIIRWHDQSAIRPLNSAKK